MPLAVHKRMIDFDLLTVYVVLLFQLILWCHICKQWLKAFTRSKTLVAINLNEMGMAPLCHGRVTNDHALKLNYKLKEKKRKKLHGIKDMTNVQLHILWLLLRTFYPVFLWTRDLLLILDFIWQLTLKMPWLHAYICQYMGECLQVILHCLWFSWLTSFKL
jgi:hypothetical protein